MKKLYRSTTDKKLAGVFGGLGAYYSVDPTVLRIAFVVFLLITGVFPGVLIYIMAALIIPVEPIGLASDKTTKKDVIDV